MKRSSNAVDLASLLGWGGLGGGGFVCFLPILPPGSITQTPRVASIIIIIISAMPAIRIPAAVWSAMRAPAMPNRSRCGSSDASH